MNDQERDRLNRFLQELVQAQATAKDLEAERLIRENCNYQPDASYLLVQRALVVEEALKVAQAENAELRAELARLRGAPARLVDANAWGSGRSSHEAALPAAQALRVNAPNGANASYAAQPAAPAETPRGSGLLGTAAGTAAGAVGGALLFQGIEQMMSSAKGSGFVGNHAAAARPASGAAEQAAASEESANDSVLASLLPSDSDLDSL